MMKNIMARAWELYRQGKCTQRAEFGLALRKAWDENRNAVNTTFLTIEFADGFGVSIQNAKYDEDKDRYAEWCRNLMMVSLGDSLKLEHIDWRDMPERDYDGRFNGCNNRVYKITEAEKDYYIDLNSQRKAEKEAVKREKRIAYLKDAIERAAKSKVYATEAEASRAWVSYNDVYNDGGDGYVPHMWTQAEVDSYRHELAELTA